ncbi:MAG: hypothetical protein ACQETE_08985 [Bacteroidota bacterium]
MKRVVNIAPNHKEAREWDIKQAISMSPRERQAIALQLKRKVYGVQNPDVKEAERKKRL